MIIFSESDEHMDRAVELLRGGAVIAIPTETVYGLAADASNPEAVKEIFHLKGRPNDNPLIVHILPEDLEKYAKNISTKARLLVESFWPGPLTLVLDSKGNLPQETTAGLDSVALRAPAHPIMQKILKASGLPLAAPSANRSGRPSPTQVKHVLEDFEVSLSYAIDGGNSDFGIESTVLDLRDGNCILLRPGSLDLEQINHRLESNGFAPVDIQSVGAESHRSPGNKYRHYAPEVELILLENQNFQDLAYELGRYENKKIGILTNEFEAQLQAYEQILMGKSGLEWSKQLYSAFRLADEKKLDLLFILPPPDDEHRPTLLNRIKKAVSKK